MADAARLTMIALSDHSTPKGVVDVVRLGETKGIRIIPAMEFDTLFEELEVYVLGYDIDYKQPYFQSLFDSLSERRQAVQMKRAKKIRKISDLDIDPATLLERYADKSPFPAIVHHVMEQYKDKEEFADYQPRGRRCKPQPANFYWDVCSAEKPCYVCVGYPSLKDTIQRIHDTGGIAVLAHPWLNFYQKGERLQRTLNGGVDGIGAYSNHHEAKHNRYYDTYCHRHGALMTCGSDSRGKMEPKIRMGEYGYEKDDGEDVLQASLKRPAK